MPSDFGVSESFGFNERFLPDHVLCVRLGVVTHHGGAPLSSLPAKLPATGSEPVRVSSDRVRLITER